jgi:transcriptional regulator NrdR family protein
VNCPICHHDTRVLRTDGTERRRQCTRCLHRFTTVEQAKEKVNILEQAVEKAREIGHLLTEVGK